MNIYIASSFDLKDRVEHVYDRLTDHGHTIPDTWWDDDLKVLNEPDEDWYDHPKVVRRAARHWTNIEKCDTFVIVTPSGDTKKFNGANIELGYAIACGLDCYSVGRLERSAMYEPVTQTDSVDKLLRYL
jgi:hypothetical protein